MINNKYEVYDDNKRLVGIFNEIADAIIFIEAYFYKYNQEEFSITIKQVDNQAKTGFY